MTLIGSQLDTDTYPFFHGIRLFIYSSQLSDFQWFLLTGVKIDEKKVPGPEADVRSVLWLSIKVVFI